MEKTRSNIKFSSLSKGSSFHIQELYDGIVAGDRVILGKVLTLAESTLPEHQRIAHKLLEKCLPLTGNSIRIGVTGSPGVGKSTFIESFGLMLIQKGRKPGVLAVDPTSQLTRGSILGDKTRMSGLSSESKAFVRASPSGDNSGGVAKSTRESMLFCEAAGFDTILIETVGVGQNEVSVYSMVDFFLLMVQPGSGDELQGIKRGVVEMADLLAVTKSDGEMEELAKQTSQDFSNAFHYFTKKEKGWSPPVLTCSGLSTKGLESIWNYILRYKMQMEESGWWASNRLSQAKNWYMERVKEQLKALLMNEPEVIENLLKLERDTDALLKSPYDTAEKLFFEVFKTKV
jgi:LAO/AO transport system kinase